MKETTGVCVCTCVCELAVTCGEGPSTQSIRNWSFSQISKLFPNLQASQAARLNLKYLLLVCCACIQKIWPGWGRGLFFLGASLRVPKGRVVRGMNCPVNGPPLHSLPRSERRKMLVEHYGLGVFVCYLGHMTEDIFFCNNTK